MNKAQRKQLYRLLRRHDFEIERAHEIVHEACYGDEYALALCLVVATLNPEGA